jgi:energy-coupling factor transport system permease protein
MQERLTFYIEGTGPLHRLNPLTKLFLVLTLIVLAFFGPGYWLPLAIFLFGILPLSIWGGIGKSFFKALLTLLMPTVVFLFVMQGFFYPGGEHVLIKLWFLRVTAEAIKAGFLIASRVLTMVSSFLLILLSTHPSLLMSDLVSRGLPAVMAYIITSSLQIVPQMRMKSRTIIDAQRARGLETEGKLITRIRALIPLVRPLIFGALLDVEERTIALEARAFTATGRKTSLMIISDSRAEGIFRRILFGICIIAIGSKIWLSFK